MVQVEIEAYIQCKLDEVLIAITTNLTREGALLVMSAIAKKYYAGELANELEEHSEELCSKIISEYGLLLESNFIKIE